MDSEVLQHLPASFQTWQKIETEAEKRAESRFQEIIKGKALRQAGRDERRISEGTLNVRDTSTS